MAFTLAFSTAYQERPALFHLVPPLSALFAWPLLGEAMPPTAWAGRTLASVGVGMASGRR